MENNVKKIRVFLKISLVILWLSSLFSLAICLMMENGLIPDDVWHFHRYITNFSGRILLVSIIQSVIIYILYILKKERELSLPIYIFLSLGFLGLFIDNIGNLFGWYSVGKSYSIEWYDDFAHFSCVVLMSIALFFLYYNYSVKLKLNSTNNILIISALACLTSFALGTIFGIYEYYSDMYLNTYMVGGVQDAITDNVFDLAGAMVAFVILNSALVRNLYHKYKRS